MPRFIRDEARHIKNLYKETSEKYIDGINVSDYKELAELARDEKDHYEFIFNKMIEVFILRDKPETKGKEEEIFKKKFTREGLEDEHWENLKNNKEPKFNLELLIKHYSSYIAYYKFYVQWILSRCLLSYGRYLEIVEQQRKIFEPPYIQRGIDEINRAQDAQYS